MQIALWRRLPGSRGLGWLWLALVVLGVWGPATGAAADQPVPLVYFGHGGQGTVSGSLHVLAIGPDLYLIDVGSFVGEAGGDYPWPEEIAVDAIRGVFITHAHADHLGRLPLLLWEGYQGPIYMTRPTYEIASLTLPANLRFFDFGPERFYYSRHQAGRDRIPVYLEGYDFGERTVRPANRVYITMPRPALAAAGYYLARPQREQLAAELRQRLARQVVIVEPGQAVTAGADGLQATFLLTSHIPGSTMVWLTYGGHSLLFSGDVGAGSSPLLPPDPVREMAVDVLFLEGTMTFDRQNGDLPQQRQRFRREVAQLVAAGKRVVIPAFVLDRSQQVMFELSRAITEGELPPQQVIRVCSPTANRLLQLYDDFARNYRREHDTTASGEQIWSHYFTPFIAEAEFMPPGYIGECSGTEPDNPLGLEPGEIGIMASGMADYSAARQALLDYLEDPGTVFYFVGYQAPASLGGRLTSGGSPPENLHIGGEQRRVRAGIRLTGAFASHADPAAMQRIFAGTGPRRLFLVHLEERRSGILADRYRRELGTEVVIPRPGQRYRLN